jgi:hypothetical protein
MTDRMHRWQVALHEAGHVLVGLLYDPHAVRSASLTSDGRRGIALQPVSLTGRQAAIFAAAGACGERYAIRWAIPRAKRRKVTTDPKTPAAMRELAVAQVFTDHATEFFKKRGHVSDNEHVGIYAVRLHPSDPNEWAGDVKRVWRDAARMVRRHKTLLRAIATQLFLEGYYFVEASDPANLHTEHQKTEIKNENSRRNHDTTQK